MNIVISNNGRERAEAALEELTQGLSYMHPNYVFDAEKVVLVEIKLFGNALILGGIYVLPENRGQGLASLALKRILESCDRHGAQLRLSIKPFGQEKGLSKVQLRSWYKRHGFTVPEHSTTQDHLERKPGGNEIINKKPKP